MPSRRPLTPYLTRRRWTSEDARAALAACDASAMSVAAFAEREGLEAQRLYRWRRQLAPVATKPTAPEFVELQVRGVGVVEVVLRCGRVLRVSESISSSTLARLASALEEVSPC